MWRFKTLALFIWLFSLSILSARPIETFYGPFEVEEEVLLHLIDHPMFQRLKHVRQYGVSYYVDYQEEYTRYDHSLGVFALLRAKGAPLKEQIAGLLHDASHTAFSHVGDWVFGKQNQEQDYQGSIHAHFLEKSGFADVLRGHGIDVQEIMPTRELAPALEDSLPNLCADRIEYNVQGAYLRGMITYDEALTIFQDLEFREGIWVSHRPDLMKKLAYFSLFMTEHCWGGPMNDVTSHWFSEALLRGIENGVLSYDMFHFGTDEHIWNILKEEKDPVIEERMRKIQNPGLYFVFVPTTEADRVIKNKFRGINPWIEVVEPDGTSQLVRLTSLDPVLCEEFLRVRDRVQTGWPIQFLKFLVS